MNARLHIILSFILIAGCIEPYDTQVKQGDQRLVVEGRITSMPGPYYVILTYSANYSSGSTGISGYITGAHICLYDNEGNFEIFVEKTRGRYYTSDNGIRGQIGRSYFIEIILPYGEVYRSEPELMMAPPAIDSIYYEYNPGDQFNSKGFEVYMDLTDPKEEQNYYKWETISWYQFSKDCWKKVYDFVPFNITSDKNFNGRKMAGIYVKTAPYNSTLPYVVNILQFSLSASAYSYLENMKEQITISGSIFDPPPTFLRGNINNPDNPDQIALGYFYVSGVVEREIAIDRTIPEESPENSVYLKSSPVYCGDPCDYLCVTFGGGKCGTEPCPPECDTLPDVSYIPPASWPIKHKRCDE